MRGIHQGRLVAALLVGASLLFTAGAYANAGGAPEGAAIDGCTCHAPEPSSEASVELDGLPDEYEPGTDYDLTLTVSGPAALPIGLNQGGFQVIVSAGSVQPAANDARNLNETTITHGSNGNDQRSWDFTWSAPTGSAATTVTFWFAGNAVNGDTTVNGDAWNKAVASVPSATGNQTDNGTSPSPSPDGDSPALGLVLSALGVATAFLATARWRSDD